MPGPPTRNPWRRWLRFSVRGLMLLVLVLGCGLGGWIAHVAHQARVRRQAIAAIWRSHGIVFSNRQRRGGAPLHQEPRWLQWLKDRVGMDMPSDAVHVSFDHLSDVELELVGHLPRLEDLDAGHSSVTDAGLAHLRGLTRLKELDLSDQEITDAGLVNLAGLTGLRRLDLSRAPITDAGLVHLAGLTGLQDLDLSHTDITDAGLTHLAGLTGLRTLDLTHTRASNAGVAHLKRLTNLRSLDLLFTMVDDFGAQEVRRALPNAKVRFDSIMAR